MAMGSVKRVITLLAGIFIAFLIANSISNTVIILTGLTGPAGMIVSIVVYAVIFLGVLHLLEKYAHIVFFGSGGE